MSGGYVFDIDDQPEEYEIRAFDNRERPAEQRMVAVLKPLSSADYARAFRGAEGEDDVTASERLFCLRVSALRNIRFRGSDGKEFEVTTARDLFRLKSRIAAKIVSEITGHYEQREAVDEKNS